MVQLILNNSGAEISKAPPQNGERHILQPETELRLEIPNDTTATLTLLQGSAEIFGAELACAPPSVSSTEYIKQTYLLSGNTKIAVFTWHGCTIDLEVEFGKKLDISYTSDETSANVAYVNTHAQLEVMRDDALMNCMNKISGDAEGAGNTDGPRVLLVGPADSGKSSLARILSAYAVKLGRIPMLVDLDPSQNMLSVPGTITASPMTPEAVSVSTHASAGATISSGTTPLVLWYGSTDLSTNPDLYKAQLDRLGQCIDSRLCSPNNINAPESDGGEDTYVPRSSGLIINTGGWIEDTGYQLLLHAVQAFRVNVILVMGHDRLYSMLQNNFSKSSEDAISTSPTPKVIKLPRSGGVVSRDVSFRRISRSLCIKRYFYGNIIRSSTSNTSNRDVKLVNQFSPTLLEIPFSDLKLYKLSSVSLSASMLPVSAKQSTDPVQLTPFVDIGPSLKHAVLAVCHPNAVEKYEVDGMASDLYLSGISGFVAVEKVNMDKETISLLSPCSGVLPSFTLLVGDITWME